MSSDSTVLIVDDNGANRPIYEAVVRDVPGAVPLYFSDPEAALEWSVQNRPLIAVVDYKMPKLNGIEFIRRFRALPNRAAVPVLMLTGVNDQRLIDEAARAGVRDFLTKPVDRQSLQKHIAHALQMQRPSTPPG